MRSVNGGHGSVTDAPLALQHFTNRYELIRLFAEYVNDEPPHETILTFYGDGGNGKSLLLRYLRRHLCKWLVRDDWAYIRNLSGEPLRYQLEHAQAKEPVPTAFLDFGQQPVFENQPLQAVSGLLMLRRELGGEKALRFPIFDFACVWYLWKKHLLTRERMAALFPSQELAMANALAGVLNSNPFTAVFSAAVQVFDKYFGKQIVLWWRKRGLDEEQLKGFEWMDPDTDLPSALPGFFASDLNTSMTLKGHPKRVALIFDTHEAFRGHDWQVPSNVYFGRDEWLRRLIDSLDLTAGIVVVVAGRERLRWAEAPHVRIESNRMDDHLVGELTTVDAQRYLHLVGLQEAELRGCLVEFASVRPGRVHPYFLGLCADIVLVAQEKGKALTPSDFREDADRADKGELLIHRLLSYAEPEIEHAVRALAACRAFNWQIYSELGRELGFKTSKSAFWALLSFSFVRPEEGPRADGYRIHDLLRRVMRDRADEATLEADRVLEEHYRQRIEPTNPVALVEAIYHANQRDWERGVAEWVNQFESALSLSDHALCRSLLDLRSDLQIRSDYWLARVSMQAGRYFDVVSRYDEAQDDYGAAIAACDRILSAAPDDVAAHNYRGLTLQILADLQVGQTHYAEGRLGYEWAIRAFGEVMRLAPRNADAYNNKGAALQRLGDLQTQLSDFQSGRVSYKRSIEAVDKALRRAPDSTAAYNNKGNALRSLGDLQAGLAQFDAAEQSYGRALDAFDEALRIAPDFSFAQNSKGAVLQRLGDLHLEVGNLEAATESYEWSIEIFHQTLEKAPDFSFARNNMGIVLQRLGDLQTLLAGYAAAAANYERSIETFDEALRLAPDYAYAHNNKGLALRRLGDLQTQLSDFQSGRVSYKRSIEAIDEALRRAPNYVYAYNNRGDTLRSFGDMEVHLANYAAAEVDYKRSIEAIDEALRRAPNSTTAYKYKGNTLHHLGDLQTALGNHEVAAESYEASLACYDRALQISPDYPTILRNRTKVALKLSDLANRLSIP